MSDWFVLLGPILLLAHFVLWWWASRILFVHPGVTLLAAYMMAWGLPIVIVGGVAASRGTSEWPILLAWDSVAGVVIISSRVRLRWKKSDR